VSAPPVDFAFNHFDPAVKADPYPHYAAMRDAGRVVSNPFLAGQFMVPGYADVLALLKDHEHFSNGRLSDMGASAVLAAPTMLDTDPPDHDRLRAVVARAFTPKSIAATEPTAAALARELVAPLADGEPVDVVDALAAPLPVQLIAELLGVASDDRDDFARWSHELMGVLDLMAPPEVRERAIAASKCLHEYFAEEARRRRARPTADDLVGRIVEANADGRLSEAEMLSSCVLLLLGGNETTTKLITNAALALFRNPGERTRLAADPSLLPTAVDEALRYDTPVQGNARIATSTVDFAGHEISEGSLVVGLLGAANRDPAQFPDPDRFDVGREPNAHLGFSHGLHHCLGAALARIEARAAIGALLEVAPGYHLPDADSLEYGPTFFFHAPVELIVERGAPI
jgi:cytochrome P450